MTNSQDFVIIVRLFIDGSNSSTHSHFSFFSFLGIQVISKLSSLLDSLSPNSTNKSPPTLRPQFLLRRFNSFRSDPISSHLLVSLPRLRDFGLDYAAENFKTKDSVMTSLSFFLSFYLR